MQLLPSLPLLRRLQSVVWSLRASDWRVGSNGMSLLCFDARLVCSASSIWTMRGSFRQTTRAELAELLPIRVPSWTGARLRTEAICTAARAGQTSIDQRYNDAGTRWDTHSSLHLTCCVCSRIQICSECSRGRSRFQPAYCSVGNGRPLWLHAVGMPDGRAHMPHMQLLRNECCSRKAAEPAISLPSTLQTLYEDQTNSCKHVYCFLKLQWSKETSVVNGPLAVAKWLTPSAALLLLHSPSDESNQRGLEL